MVGAVLVAGRIIVPPRDADAPSVSNYSEHSGLTLPFPFGRSGLLGLPRHCAASRADADT
jgi:hypothetical protein